MKRIAMLLLVATALATVASAANWIEVAKSKDGKTTLYLDYDSIQRHGDIVSIWDKVIDENGEFSLGHDQFRRDTRQFRMLSFTQYAKDGHVLKGQDYGESASWSDIPPESLIDAAYKLLFNP